MAWEPKDPWGGSGQDPLDEALRKAKDQISNLVPGRGFKRFGRGTAGNTR